MCSADTFALVVCCKNNKTQTDKMIWSKMLYLFQSIANATHEMTHRFKGLKTQTSYKPVLFVCRMFFRHFFFQIVLLAARAQQTKPLFWTKHHGKCSAIVTVKKRCNSAFPGITHPLHIMLGDFCLFGCFFFCLLVLLTFQVTALFKEAS